MEALAFASFIALVVAWCLAPTPATAITTAPEVQQKAA